MYDSKDMFDTNEVLEKYSEEYDLKKGLLFKMIDDFNLKPIEVMNGKLKTFKFDAEEVKKIGEILHLRKVDNRRIHSIQMILGVHKSDAEKPEQSMNNADKQFIDNPQDFHRISTNDIEDIEYDEIIEKEVETRMTIYKQSQMERFNSMLIELRNESFMNGKLIGSLSAELEHEKKDKERLLIESQNEVLRIHEQSINSLSEAEERIKTVHEQLEIKNNELEKIRLDLLKERSEKMSLKQSLIEEKSKTFWQRILGR